MPVQTWDGVLTPALAEQFQALLPWLPAYFLNRTDRDPQAHPLDVYWHYPIAMSDDPYTGDITPELQALDDALQPVATLWDSLRERLGFPVRLYECEYGANPFGCEGHAHHDTSRVEWRDQHVAIIVYLNPTWDLSWGGETVIFDEAQDIAHAVLPKPGRATVIEGDPLHVARGVARSCPVARRILVFKMWRV